ncbi:MAG: HEAT repeat domain-containing protein [Acidobacteriota bacterium]
MRTLFTVFAFLLAISASMPALAAQAPPAGAAGFAPPATEAEQSREEELYQRGTAAIDEGQWQKALDNFSEVAKLGGKRADAGLFYKAKAQFKLGRGAEARATVATLKKGHPKSNWVDDAEALEIEIRQAAGEQVPAADLGDEELKLLALNSLMHNNSEEALPLVEKFLRSSTSPKLRERAMFVLAQSSSPRARAMIADIARGKLIPELQMKAIQNLGLFGGEASRQVLAEIYTASGDLAIKKKILSSFMISGERGRLLALAREEKMPELRSAAVQQLGVMGAHAELWELYQKESAVEVKKKIQSAMFVGGNVDKLSELARIEKDPELRLSAIRNLGIMGSKKSTDTLLAIYAEDKDPAVRKAVINGLFIQGNARALIDLARKETDPAVKRDLVSKLSIMGSKEATEYLMEILNK